MNALEDIRDMLYEELECVAEKGKLNVEILEIIDKLTHSLKSIDTIMAMNDYDNGYSQRNMRYPYSKRTTSNNIRTSRGILRDDGYSYRDKGYQTKTSREDLKEKMIEKLHEYLEDVESDKVRDSIQKVISQIESED